VVDDYKTRRSREPSLNLKRQASSARPPPSGNSKIPMTSKMNPSVHLFLFLVFMFSCTPAAVVGRTSLFRRLNEDLEAPPPFINEVIAMSNDADTLSNDDRIIISHYFGSLNSFAYNFSQFTSTDEQNAFVEVIKRKRRKRTRERRLQSTVVRYTLEYFDSDNYLSGSDQFACWDDVYFPPDADFIPTNDDWFEDSFYQDVNDDECGSLSTRRVQEDDAEEDGDFEYGSISTRRVQDNGEEDDGDFAYLFITVNPSGNITYSGGYVCLSGTDENGVAFSNLIKFGSTGSTPPVCATKDGEPFYEDITLDTGSVTPRQGESFQRTGEGSVPKEDDFIWIVAKKSPEDPNVGQKLDKFDPNAFECPNCTQVDKG
jgi:hypothetical protein